MSTVISTRVDREIVNKFKEKAVKQGCESSEMLRKLIYSFLGMDGGSPKTGHVDMQKLSFSLEIEDYKRRNCKHNEDGICGNWYFTEDESKKYPFIHFVKRKNLLFEECLYGEAVPERCAFCDSYKREEAIRLRVT